MKIKKHKKRIATGTKKILLLLAFCTQLAHAQILSVECPRYANKEIVLTLTFGIKNDTVYNGKLDARGTAVIAIPEFYAGYVGLGVVTVDRNPSLTLIINGENPAIQEQAEDMVEISNSLENTVQQSWMNEQNLLWQKIYWLNDADRFYNPSDPLYATLQQEKKNLQTADLEFDGKLNESPLYAADRMKFYRFLNRKISFLTEADDTQREEVRTFVRDSLDMEKLYTSGLWFGVLNGLLVLYDKQSPFHALFAQDMIPALNRIRSNRIHTGMLEDLFVICDNMGWSDPEKELSYYAVNDERIVNPSTRIQALKDLFKLAKGSPAPALNGATAPPRNTVLFFYQSECGHCQSEAEELINQYARLKELGYEVISLAADENRPLFEETAAAFPWTDKRNDEQGIEGENFKRYGVIATPTLYLIDEKGIILGRYARVKDINFRNNKR